MTFLNVVIVAALLVTIGLMGTGIWSMAHGGDFDQKHSTQLMMARVGMQMKHYGILPEDHDWDRDNLASLTLTRKLEEVAWVAR